MIYLDRSEREFPTGRESFVSIDVGVTGCELFVDQINADMFSNNCQCTIQNI